MKIIRFDHFCIQDIHFMNKNKQVILFQKRLATFPIITDNKLFIFKNVDFNGWYLQCYKYFSGSLAVDLKLLQLRLTVLVVDWEFIAIITTTRQCQPQLQRKRQLLQEIIYCQLHYLKRSNYCRCS